MATESFDKEFILNTQEQVDAFIKAIEDYENRKTLDFDRSLTSEENIKRGEAKLDKMLNTKEEM
jgi:hypothetical protein